VIESAELGVFARGYSNSFIVPVKRHVRLIFRMADDLEIRPAVSAHLDLDLSGLPHGAAPPVKAGIEYIGGGEHPHHIWCAILITEIFSHLVELTQG